MPIKRLTYGGVSADITRVKTLVFIGLCVWLAGCASHSVNVSASAFGVTASVDVSASGSSSNVVTTAKKGK